MTDSARRDPWLLTPGPLTTSLTVKQAMLHDWGSRDKTFIEINRRVREKLVATAGSSPSHRAGLADTQCCLGKVLSQLGKLSEAETLFQAARATVEELAATSNPEKGAHVGTLGELVDPLSRRKRRIGEDILDTAAAIQPQAARLGCVEAVRELADGVRRGYSDAGWLRQRLAAAGSLADVVRESAALWAHP